MRMAGLLLLVVVRGGLGILDKDVVALDVEERVLSKVSGIFVVVLVNQVGLSPEWAQARSLKGLPPRKVFIEGLVPDVNLKLKLAKRKGFAGGNVGLEQGRDGLEFPAFNINLEDVNVCMTIFSHQSFEGEHGWALVGFVRTCKSDGLEMCAMGAITGNFWAKRLDAEIISPDLAVVGLFQDRSLERRLVVNTEGIDDTVWLLCDARDAAYPFTTVAKGTEALDIVWAVECGREEVPDGIWRPR